jgi:hypothetical protein
METEAPFKGELTIVWESEKREILERLDTHAQMLQALSERIQTLEAWAIQLKREPTMFTK